MSGFIVQTYLESSLDDRASDAMRVGYPDSGGIRYPVCYDGLLT